MANSTGTSLSRTAYESLTERLVLLDIAPGSPINEQDLMGSLGIGRTPLREALKRLESDHLVVTYPRRGTFASPVDITALTEISEIRRSLEPLAARLAAQRADADDRAAAKKMRAQLSKVRPDIPARDAMNLDLQVHHAIYRATHNHHLRTALERYGNLATRIWSVAAPRLTHVDSHVTEHVELLDAVVVGDAAVAESLMVAHMDDFEQRIRTVL
ncbi:GntR family transcriptional regulator [Calidifontibacter terrae]